MRTNPFTVIGVHPENNQTFCAHVMANNRMHAFAVCAQEPNFADAEFVCALDGHLYNGKEVDFAGDALVDAETILEQTDVFS